MEVVVLQTQMIPNIITIQCGRILALNIPKYGRFLQLSVANFPQPATPRHAVNILSIVTFKIAFFLCKRACRSSCWTVITATDNEMGNGPTVPRKKHCGARGLIARGSRAHVSSNDMWRTGWIWVPQSLKIKQAQAIPATSQEPWCKNIMRSMLLASRLRDMGLVENLSRLLHDCHGYIENETNLRTPQPPVWFTLVGVHTSLCLTVLTTTNNKVKRVVPPKRKCEVQGLATRELRARMHFKQWRATRNWDLGAGETLFQATKQAMKCFKGDGDAKQLFVACCQKHSLELWDPVFTYVLPNCTQVSSSSSPSSSSA